MSSFSANLYPERIGHCPSCSVPVKAEKLVGCIKCNKTFTEEEKKQIIEEADLIYKKGKLLGLILTPLIILGFVAIYHVFSTT